MYIPGPLCEDQPSYYFNFTVFSYEYLWIRRFFYLVKEHTGCANDPGWFMVVDGSGCSYDDVGPKPLILYAVDQNMNFVDGEQILINTDAHKQTCICVWWRGKGGHGTPHMHGRKESYTHFNLKMWTSE